MSFNKSKLAVAVAAAAGLTFSSGAFATNGILQAGNGMVAHGMGGAGLANAGEASAGMDNPALISQTGDAVGVAWNIFMPDRSWTYSVPGYSFTAKSDNNMFAIPQVAFTSKINDGMSWGIMAYALGGMNTDYRTDMFSGNPSTVDLSGMIIAPTMSFAVGKSVSIGASLLIAYENFRGRNVLGSGNADEGSAMGYGAKLGANWMVTDGISIAAMVQPKIAMGEINWWENFLAGSGVKDTALTTPNEYGIGGKFAVGKNVDIVADLMYYQWSDVEVFEFFGWDDQVIYKLGVEFRPSDKLSLRAGVNYGKSPIQGDVLPPSGGGFATAVMLNSYFPAVSETHITVGLGYKMDKNMAFNAYYLYSPKTTISDSITPFSIEMTQNAFGLGVNYQTK